MKKALLFVFILFLAVGGFSQTYNFADHNGISRTYGMVGLNGSSFYLEESTPLYEACRDYLSLVGRNNYGKEIFRKDLDTAAYLRTVFLGLLSDSTFLVVSGTTLPGCDTDGDRFKLVKTDTAGNILVQKIIEEEVRGIYCGQNGHFWVFTDLYARCYENAGFTEKPFLT